MPLRKKDFLKHHLDSLTGIQKWHTFKRNVGDVVIIEEDNAPRNKC